MSDPAIGKTENVSISLVPRSAGAKLVCITASGKYLGTVEFDAIDPQALTAIGNLFQQFTAQQSGGIQVAGAMPGLRVS